MGFSDKPTSAAHSTRPISTHSQQGTTRKTPPHPRDNEGPPSCLPLCSPSTCHLSHLVYLEVDKETTRVIAEIQPGAAPRATGRFWVDEEGPYRIQEAEWTRVFNNGELDITNIMSSDLRSDLMNLVVQYQRSGGQVGLGRRVPSAGVTT